MTDDPIQQPEAEHVTDGTSGDAGIFAIPPTAAAKMDELARTQGWTTDFTLLDERTQHSRTLYRRGTSSIEVMRMRGRIMQADFGTHSLRGGAYGKRQAIEKALMAKASA